MRELKILPEVTGYQRKERPKLFGFAWGFPFTAGPFEHFFRECVVNESVTLKGQPIRGMWMMSLSSGASTTCHE
jgi:hypothetical protein